VFENRGLEIVEATCKVVSQVESSSDVLAFSKYGSGVPKQWNIFTAYTQAVGKTIIIIIILIEIKCFIF
jgi:hypothetical protein